MIDTSVELAGVVLPNPVLPASGTYEVAEVHDGFFSPSDLAAAIDRSGSADMIELDLSCPNLEERFIWAADEAALSKAVTSVVNVTRLPVISKLSPNVWDISEMAVIAERAGAAAVSMVNSYQGMAIDIGTRKPILGNITGGLT